MEWYYTVLIAILVILAIVLIFLYIFRERIFNWVMAAILGVYIASPLDLLPDFIPIAGWGDDIAALVLMVGFIVRGFKMMYNKKNDNDTQVKQLKGNSMEDKEIFYKRERLVPREQRLVPRKSSERIFTDPFILSCLVILLIMIIIVLVLHFS